MEVNGIAHIFLSVRNYEECAAFYRQLLPAIGLTFVVRDNPDSLYCIGGRTGFGIARADAGLRDVPFTQGRPGLHHVCFRARSRKDVEFAYELARKLGAKIIHAPDEGQWAPGYYSVLFEDPDGIRLEVNFIPGRGLLEDKAPE